MDAVALFDVVGSLQNCFDGFAVVIAVDGQKSCGVNALAGNGDFDVFRLGDCQKLELFENTSNYLWIKLGAMV